MDQDHEQAHSSVYLISLYKDLFYDSDCTMTSKIINAASVTPKVVIMIPRVAGKYPFVMALYDKELIRL